jgi:hypothetical protein
MTVRATVGAVVAILIAAVLARAEESPRFVPARYDEAERVVRFVAPVEVDWHAGARRHFRRFDPDRPSARDVASLRDNVSERYAGAAEERFRFAPAPDVRRATYYLLSIAGVGKLQVQSYEGAILFGFDNASPPNFVGARYHGEAVSQPGAAGGGFALLTPLRAAPTRIAAARAELSFANGRPLLSYIEGAIRISAVLDVPQPRWFTRIETAYGVRIAGRRFLFVAWPPDTSGDVGGFCEKNFSLYAVDATLRDISSNSYDCDI